MKKINTLIIVLLNIVIVNICYSQSSHESKLYAFKNANVISMVDDKITENQTIIIENGIIKEIGLSSGIETSKNMTIINAEGMYIMPGLADMHTHLYETYYKVPNLNLFLANGVTTIRDMNGAMGQYILDWKNEVSCGIRPGPTIVSGSPILHSISPNVKDEVDGYINKGFEFIKIYSDLSKKDFIELIEITEAQNVYTVGHLPYSVRLDDASKLGLDEIAHVNQLIPELLEYDRNKNCLTEEEWSNYIFINLFITLQEENRFSRDILINEFQPEIKNLGDRLEKLNIPITTTLYCDLIGSIQLSFESFSKTKNIEYLPNALISKIKNKSETYNEEMIHNYELAGMFYKVLDSLLIKELYDRNIPIVLGTDVGATNMGIVPGYSIHKELDLLVGIGLSPYEAIKTGTVNANKIAKKIGLQEEFGTVEVGKKADLILLKNNPLKDISYLQNNEGVMASGIWYTKKELNKMMKINHIPKPGADILFEIFKKKGFETMIFEYKKSKNATQNKDRKLNIDEYQLNILGYKFLTENLLEEALKTFELNTKAHPYSANCYDSWAEAYLKSGNAEKAIEYYNKAIRLNPHFEHPKKELLKLKSTSYGKN